MSAWHSLFGVGGYPAEFGDAAARSGFALADEDVGVRASGHYAGVPGRNANSFVRRMRGAILMGADRVVIVLGRTTLIDSDWVSGATGAVLAADADGVTVTFDIPELARPLATGSVRPSGEIIWRFPVPVPDAVRAVLPADRSAVELTVPQRQLILRRT